MKIRIADIRPQGLELDEPLTGAWLAEALQGFGGPELRDDVEAGARGGSGRVTARVTRVEPNLFVRGRVVADLALPCSRCLGAAALHVSAEVDLTLVPRPPDLDLPAEQELTSEDLDFGYYDETDTEIDLAEVVREHILLEIPISPLCREECRGLCGRCGQDLNAGPCDCPPPPGDPRLAKLATLKLTH